MIFVFSAILGLSFAASVGAVENVCTCKPGLSSSKMFCSLGDPNEPLPIKENHCNGRIIKDMTLQLLSHTTLTSSQVPPFRLTKLSIKGEHLKEVSHDAFGAHESLYFLDIINGDLVEVPTAAINNMSSLITLNLAKNAIRSVDCSITIRYLGEIILSNNRISNIDSCAFPFYVYSLVLTDNLITTLNGSLKNHHRLQRVYVQRNKLTNLDGQLVGLEKLSLLDASWNKIEVVTSTSMTPNRLNRLFQLNLSHNRISEIGMNLIQFSNLALLDLSYNYIERLDNGVFANVDFLIYLRLSGNRIRYIGNEAFSRQRNLHELTISHNVITSLDGKLNNLRSLRRLDASWNYLKSFGMAIKHLTSLVDLNLSQNRISDFGDFGDFGDETFDEETFYETSYEETFYELDTLKRFDISYNNLEFIKTDTFDRFPNIVDLNLSGNKIRALNGNQFISLKDLRSLDLSYTGLPSLEDLVVPGFMKMENGTDNHWVDKKSPLEGWINEECICRSDDVMRFLRIEGNILACFRNHTEILDIMDRSNIEVTGCDKR